MFSLRNLEAGEFYVFGPAITKGVEKVKVAKVKTTHPKVGMDLRSKISPPTQKIKSMLSKLNDLPQEAEHEAKTIKELKQQVRELKRDLKKKPAPAIDERQLELAEKRGFGKANKEYYQQISNLNKQVKNLNNKLKKIADLTKVEISTVSVSPELVISREKIHKSSFVPRSTPRPVARQINHNGDDKSLNRCARSILSLLYNNPQKSFKKTILGPLTGYSHKSGGFNNALSRLKIAGLIIRGAEISISPEGNAQAPSLLGDDIELHEEFTVDNWAWKLPRCASIIYQFLKEKPDTEFSKEEIAEQTGYQPDSGGFNNAISKLNQLRLINRINGRIKFNEEILEL